MSHLHKSSAPCTKSEVDLFSVPPTQTAIEESQYITVSPINSVSGVNNTPIDFVIPPLSDYFTDLSSAALSLKIQLVFEDDTPLPADYPASPECNFLHSYFSQSSVSLNGKRVSSSSCNYAYRAYLEKLINYSITSKRTHLQTCGYFIEGERAKYAEVAKANKDKVFDFYGKLHGDVFQQSNLLLNSVETRLRLIRSPSRFHINVGALVDGQPRKNVVAKILDVELFVRRVKLSSHVYLGVERHLTRDTAKYPIRRVETRSYTIPNGLSSKSINNVVTGNLPQKVIFGILPHQSELGDYMKSCFHFTNSDLQQVSLCVNGSPVVKPYDLDFTSDATNLKRAYFDLFFTNGFIGSNSNGITFDEFKSVTTLFSFDLTQDQCSNFFSHINPIKQGDLSLKLKFKTPLTESVSVLFFLEFLDIIEITRSRSVLYET